MKFFTQMREYWLDYGSEVVFFLLCMVIMVLSTWAGQFIPDALYDDILTPVFNTCTVVVSFAGAWMLFRRSEGIRARKLFAWALVVWGICDLIYLVGWVVAPHQVMDMAAHELTTYELLAGNILGWVLLMYPTEALRPGWLNWERTLYQLLPLVVLAALDYMLNISLWPVIALYPYILLLLLFSHMHAYQKWCEDNFSSLDNIDVRWLIRYSTMLLMVGLNFIWMCSTHYHARGFTQQWFVVVMLIYSIDQILFRKDPWREVVLRDKGTKYQVPSDPYGEADRSTEGRLEVPSTKEADEIAVFEQWMETDKPYRHSEFQLMDLRQVLPKNRTYLSQLINSAYGCSFFQLVNRYRVEEAQRLMAAHPEMKMGDVSSACGFSSPAVFSRTFARITGMSPREWSAKQ